MRTATYVAGYKLRLRKLRAHLTMVPRLLEKYRNEIVAQMMQSFKFKNKMQVPRVRKIVVNMGVGETTVDIKVLDRAMEELGLITGQKPIICRSKKAISNFKIRKGLAIGCKVTLRKNIMYEFLDRLVNVAIPRIRDFRGINPDSFAGASFSLGLNEQTIFPEIEYDKILRPQGMNITIVTDAKSSHDARELLKMFGMPFQTKT